MARCRRRAAMLAALGAITVAAGCKPDATHGIAIGTPTAPPPVTSVTTTATAPAARPSSSDVTSGAARSPALTLLAGIRIKGRAANTGYARAQFGSAWTDDNDDPGGRNGCDTRNDILRRDLDGAVLKPGSNGCTVLSGTLHDPYTGTTIAFTRGARTSSAVQIDHVVALDDAWQKGAQQWDAQRRTDLANDPLNLLAVNGPTNEAKGSGDAATWLPPSKSFRCSYVARQVAVKARYGLWMTQAEHDAIAGILQTCPGQQAPREAGAPPVVSSPTSTTAAAPNHTPSHSTAKPAAHPSSHSSSHSSTPAAGAKTYPNCAALNVDYPHGVGRPGARDHTASGRDPVTDFTVDAALYAANAARDGDDDGVACERH